MPLKRSKDQIIAQILELCQGEGASKTRIVYQINLNFHSVNIYLNTLIEKGCIESNQGDRTIYKTTSRGEDALVILQKAREIFA